MLGARADWSGGTRIGEALAGSTGSGRAACSARARSWLLFTDGLERDGVDQLAGRDGAPRSSSRRVIWVNPLLRFDGFSAKAQGVRAMLPHVDFVPADPQSRQHGRSLQSAVGRTGRAKDPKAWLRRPA